MMQFLVGTAAWLGVTRIVALFGDTTLAGYTITLRLIHFAIPFLGNQQRRRHAGRPEPGREKTRPRRKSRLHHRLRQLRLAGLIAVVFWAFAGPLTGAFTSEPGVFDVGVKSLKIISGGYVFFGFAMVVLAGFQRLGDTDTPTLLNFFCYWCWQLPLAYYLSKTLGIGVEGVYYAVIVSGATWALVGWLLFRRGKWKTRVI